MRRETKRPGAGATATGPGLSIVADDKPHNSERPTGQSSAADRRRPSGSQQRGRTLFEQEQGRYVWRLEDTTWNGQPRLQVWPWYRSGGELRPCSAKYGGGGFSIPHERLPELMAALASVRREAS